MSSTVIKDLICQAVKLYLFFDRNPIPNQRNLFQQVIFQQSTTFVSKDLLW